MEGSVSRRHLRPAVGEGLRTLVLAGIPVGVLVAGVGSRLCMLLLRATSGDEVRGIRSDDGFEIGRFTVGGTYNLLALGATIGIIGAAAYQWVRPWLLGPRWLRYLTVAAAAGAVVGALLVHSDGVDFTVLTPTWLTVGSFVVLPALFGAAIGPAVEAVEAHATRNGPDRPSPVAPIVLVALFPPTLVVLAVAAIVLLAWTAVRDHPPVNRAAHAPLTGIAARAVWLIVAIAGADALVQDINQLNRTT